MDLIMKDRANKEWLIGKKKLKTTRNQVDKKAVTYNLMTLFLLIATVAILFSAAAVVASTASVTSANTDNLLSDDMAEYTAIYGHDADFDEGDMQ
jgi:hypothetical protein